MFIQYNKYNAYNITLHYITVTCVLLRELQGRTIAVVPGKTARFEIPPDETPLDPSECWLRPVRLLRVSISEGLTQTNS